MLGTKMVKLNEEAKKAIETVRPCLVATSSVTGKPNVSAKGSVQVLDDEHVTFVDVASPRTIKNLRQNPQVSIICLDYPTRKGCRVWGKAEVLSSGDLFVKVAAVMQARRNQKVDNVVKVTVEEVELF
jgi:uncharacterized protein